MESKRTFRTFQPNGWVWMLKAEVPVQHDSELKSKRKRDKRRGEKLMPLYLLICVQQLIT